jgi:hypothetical protein
VLSESDRTLGDFIFCGVRTVWLPDAASSESSPDPPLPIMPGGLIGVNMMANWGYDNRGCWNQACQKHVDESTLLRSIIVVGLTLYVVVNV